ncbi:molybdopterin-dependent oxidoreductase [Paenibacillus qinlingensis]|uniref:molybdopterin-dependent oxidoreductase n=1 Tax=Paenibacillus qinlingensis TaxID=1837343 RepID=UPI0023678B01|nr:molybdopterin-dependent oxidoreductase [Paenibacillus qinlingensis]
MRERGLGKKLRKLHSANAWVLLFLAVSGILLYIPPMRALLGEGRVWVKQMHIAVGLVSLAVVILYLPSFLKHLRQLSGRRAQQGNLVVVLLLLAGWIGSGIILWRYRSFPPIWNNTALLVHDLLTWIGIPYALYHSFTRSRWLIKAGREKDRNQTAPLSKPLNVIDLGTYEPATGKVFRRISRRSFIKMGVGSIVAAATVPPFIRFLTSVFGDSNLSSLQETESMSTDVLQLTPLPDSLPPKGGGAKGNFRIYTVTDMPKFDPEKWTFTVDGLVNQPFQWSWTEFLAFPRQVQISDFHCVTGWSVNSCTWEGIPLNKLLEHAGVKDGVKMVKFYSAEGVYTDNITIEQTWMEDVMVVLMLDGKPIPRDMGGPVRLVVPQMYAYKSVKWLNRIELIDSDHTGYWEQRGYAKDAWIWVPPM